MPLLALALTSTFSACSESKGDEEGGGDDGGNPPAGALTPEENKERLSEIGNEFVKLIPASDFNEIDQLTSDIKNEYCNEDRQTDEIEQWADRCFRDLIESTWTEYPYDYTTNKYTRRIYRLSQFHAHIEFKNGHWDVQEGVNDLQATCTLNGQTVVARLTTHGNTKRVYAGEIEMDEDYDYYYNNTIYEVDRAYFEIPEEVHIQLTRGNQALVNITLKTDLSSLSSENFDLSKDEATVQLTAELAGYNIQCQRIAAKANTDGGLYAKFSITKNGRALLTAETKGSVSLPSGLVWSEQTDEDDFEEKLENFNGGKVTLLSLDLLGRLQVSGYCTDARKFFEAFERADDGDNKRDAEVVRECARDANSCFKALFFYDGSSTAQGAMEFEAVANSRGDKYYLEPIMVFADGSRYNMTNESYFSEENFKSLVDLFDSLANGYEDMVEKYDE